MLLLIILLWWDWDTPVPDSLREIPETATVAQTSVFPSSHGQSQRQLPQEECVACPDFQIEDLEAKKRFGVSQEEQDTACFDLLRQAAVNGNPNPDMSHLGGCSGTTPLHVARTLDQVQGLIEAGADINARDLFGRTPLHSQSLPIIPTDESVAIVKLLLEAGADALVEDNQGLTTWKYAVLHSHVDTFHLARYNRAVERAASQGVSLEDYLDQYPHEKARIDSFLSQYLVQAQIRRALLKGASDQWKGSLE